MTTERQAQSKAAHEPCAAAQTADFAAILGECADGIAVLDRESRYVFVNHAVLRLLGRIGREVIGKTVGDVSPHLIGGTAEREIRRALDENTATVCESQIPHEGGAWFEMRCCPNADTLIVFFHDISERKALEAEREELLAVVTERAERDSLTGLWNRRAFDARLASEIERARRDNLTLAVAVMDLNNFKFLNDAYGHLSGDDALQKVSAAILSCCRSYDIAARLGGDEFALILPGMATGEIPDLYARLASAVDAVEFQPKGYAAPIPLTLAVGVATLPDDAWSVEDLLLLADERLARDKTGERDGGPPPSDAVRTLLKGDKDLAMLDALVTAVDNKDRYTRRHSLDVMTYSLLIAGEMVLDADATRSLQIAALLHDVGKIGVPDRILRLPTRLTGDEYNAIKLHPVMGAAIVGAVAGLDPILPAIRHHHEAWDGTGYPDNLAGAAIPLWARILSVADAYSAMTTNRPYRRSLGPPAAAVIIEAGGGTQWDPACVRAFLRAFRKADPDLFFKR